MKNKERIRQTRKYEGILYESYDGVHWDIAKPKRKKTIKYKHFATGKIIEVIYVDIDKTVVYCEELNKRFIVIEDGDKKHLKGTSYMEKK